MTKRYVHGPGTDEHLAMEKGGKVYYFHSDGLGSITSVTDKADKVVESYTYDAYGNFKKKGGRAGNPYAFTGREYDNETGLYYYRARYYDANIGRFITRDPIGFKGGINLYNYVNSNSVNLVDPFGTSGMSVALGLASYGVNTAALIVTFSGNLPLGTALKVGGVMLSLTTIGNAYLEYDSGQISRAAFYLTTANELTNIFGAGISSIKMFGEAGQAIGVFTTALTRSNGAPMTAYDLAELIMRKLDEMRLEQEEAVCKVPADFLNQGKGFSLEFELMINSSGGEL